MTLCIINLCGKILGILPGKASRYIASALGAAAAFIIFVPMESVILQLVYRLMVSVFVVGVAFPLHSGRLLLRAAGTFYVVSFLVAGVVAGLFWLFPTAGFYSGNGAVYFNIRPLTLLGAVAVAYGAVELFDRFNARRTPPREIFQLTIEKGGRKIPLKALADSGNRLTEPFSGLPVVVVTARAVWPLLSEEEKKVVSEQNLSSAVPGVRWVLCRSVADSCLLPAFLPDTLSVRWEGRETPVGAYFAVSPQGIGEADGSYSAVFNPKMIQVLLR